MPALIAFDGVQLQLGFPRQGVDIQRPTLPDPTAGNDGDLLRNQVETSILRKRR